MPPHKPPALRLQAELRWAANAHTLIWRPDRVHSLEKRIEQVMARRAVVEEACTELLASDAKQGVLDSCLADYEQFFSLTDDLIEAGAKYANEASEARLSGQPESPRKQPTQPELLGRLPTLGTCQGSPGSSPTG
ncbi:unnamed protein product [Parnassius apollo]|uniref:(apollo) hypothetical protein n=1 Tax=Parnassius apollo TaxID=110799 RepID=A0A8S3XLL0_PARAO|nr:unnamed protein product [Parnassius apollo]